MASILVSVVFVAGGGVRHPFTADPSIEGLYKELLSCSPERCSLLKSSLGAEPLNSECVGYIKVLYIEGLGLGLGA